MRHRAAAWVVVAWTVLGLILFACLPTATNEPEGQAASALAGTLVSIAVTPSPASLAAGTTLALTATGTYSTGKTKALNGMTWTTGSLAVTVDSKGLVTGIWPGTAVVTATDPKTGLSGTATITVTAAVLKSITLSVSGGQLPVNITETITATGTFSDGSTAPLAASSLTWSSKNPLVVNIPSPGEATGLLAGSTTKVTATNGTISGSLNVTVSSATLSSLAVTPATASIKVTQTQAFTATGTFSDGSLHDLTTSVTWAAANVVSLDAGADVAVDSAPDVSVDVAVDGGGGSVDGATDGGAVDAGTTGADTGSPDAGSSGGSDAGGLFGRIGPDGVATGLDVGTATITATFSSSISASATLTVTPDITWTLTGAMTTPRCYDTATLLPSGQVLLAGGVNIISDTEIILSSAELYDHTGGAWLPTVGPMTTARLQHTATLLDSGQVLVAGGVNGGALSSAELYNPGTGTFAATGSMNTTRYLHTATLLSSGKVLLAAGTNNVEGYNASLSSAELYDPTVAGGTCSPTMGPLNVARQEHTATLLGSGKVLLVGGWGSTSFLSSAELYDPVTETFTPTASMTTARDGHTATLLSSGKVLVAGGVNVNSSGTDVFLSSAEVYDPVAGTFRATGSMTTARLYHTATLLGSGEVLITGGCDEPTCIGLSSGELYDPTTGTFAPAGSMNTARYFQTATLLATGQVLGAGGTNNGGNAFLSSAELYP